MAIGASSLTEVGEVVGGAKGGHDVGTSCRAVAGVENADRVTIVETLPKSVEKSLTVGQLEGDDFRHTLRLRAPPTCAGEDVMATVRYERRIAAPADTVWNVVKDPASIPQWFPGIVGCDMDGKIRTIHLANGISMPEEIITSDSILRRFAYRITSPLYSSHLGTIDVIEVGENDSLCVYSTTAEPDVLALVIGGGSYAALAEIERLALAES